MHFKKQMKISETLIIHSDKYHVDLVLQAHSHNYQRSFPLLYNDKEPSRPIITEKNKVQYSDPKGSIFVVTGTGGADQHNFTGQAPFIDIQFQRFGFLDVRVTNNGTRMNVPFTKIEMVLIRITLLLQNRNRLQLLNRRSNGIFSNERIV